MDHRDEGLEMVPRNLDACPTGSCAPKDRTTLAAANLLRQNGSADIPPSMIDKPWSPANDAEAQQAALRSILFKHWDVIKAEGITASQFVDFLQPLADLDGITVSYIDGDEDNNERVYDHRRREPDVHSPRSQAIP
ncbi:hypothetical protein LJR290_003980 [Variovorax sp. LjRoot290]|uniref:hypothetical protein n=1 Tax=unclassified Variovorax TaxID=663243 RepID=UPI003ECE3A19